MEVKISGPDTPLPIHFRLYLKFYDNADNEKAHTWAAYNFIEQGKVDAPIFICRDACKPGCVARPDSMKKVTVPGHFIFKLARKNVIIVDGVEINYAVAFTSDCYAGENWDSLFTDGIVSKMRLQVEEYTASHLKPVSSYLSFSYRIYIGRFCHSLILLLV